MFEYLEPDASGASSLPPSASSRPQPHPERLRHLLYGSRIGIDRTIKILHAYGYADPNDWSAPIPTDQPGQWMAILTKTLLVE
ncbi:hypothetical protein PGN35_013485 [Nodosilinea sp. PGN35]|uniref:hypothetical protein n=1 Tax=Nodosilinea sp. PGN35 TaxID=3020489 RepID=UPI0023B30FA9|nr:hypothetical protein [Nodosilinea sp. TSF1-S3]MDF0366165.1 hypothetical protein [Nodosilinea sp. TSF1-S3]